MKDAVLMELAHRWEMDAREPECEDGSKEAERGNAISEGIRQGKRECADTLRELISLIGDK
jgi:hypothetical protein